MSVRFCPLASGSSGNSVFASAGQTNLLIDAGLSGKAIETSLASINIDPKTLNAVFITHEHSDHIHGAGVMSRRYDIPIYATPGTWVEMDRSKQLGKITPNNRKFVYPDSDIVMGDFVLRAFDISHDAKQPVGYTLLSGNRKMAVATDLGEFTHKIIACLRNADILLLESNHDVEMLTNGKYPIHLKRRILGKNGHLSNVSAGQLICDIVSEKLKHVFLGHLSEENNRPLIAFDTVCRILQANDVKINCENGIQLSVAERYTASRYVILD